MELAKSRSLPAPYIPGYPDIIFACCNIMFYGGVVEVGANACAVPGYIYKIIVDDQLASSVIGIGRSVYTW